MEGQKHISESKYRRPEHLKIGIKPIMACVGIYDQFKCDPGPMEVFTDWQALSPRNNAHDVNYYGRHEELVQNKFKNPRSFSYVISPIDGLDKFSSTFRNCTGVIVAGRDRKTGKNISFLSHQDPDYFLSSEENKKTFVVDLEERLAEFKQNCENGTIDAVVLGGNYLIGPQRGDQWRQSYLDSVKLLSAEISKVLGFEPVVITGPKKISGDDNVFYDNENRRVYIQRPMVGDATTKPFVSRDIDEQKKDWEK